MSDLKSVLTGTQVPSAAPTDYVVPAPPSSVGVFFWDDFASGNKSKTMNGFKWAFGRSVVSNDIAYTGTYSLKFTYEGTAPTNGLNNEQNFEMGADYNETYIKFMLYLPNGAESWGGAAYSRHTDGATSNHKLMRMWGNWPWESGHDGYNSGGKNIGASTWPVFSYPHPGSKVSMDFNNTVNYADTIWSTDDLGTWVEIQIGVKSSTSSTSTDGFAKVWKNGSLVADFNNINNWVDNDRPDIIRNMGYLLGAANGGFYEETYVFIDNIVFSTNFIT